MKNILCIILVINGLHVYGQATYEDVYDFPIKQGSKEWV